MRYELDYTGNYGGNMPTISAKIILNPRKQRRCAIGIYCNGLMAKGTPQMRLYGSGYNGDPKYTVYICMECASKSYDKKVKAAMMVATPPAQKK